MINNKRKNKNAFTLAEILLTLTILGVVAAITIPLIQNIIPSTNKALFRKSYLTLQRAIENMLNNETIYPSDMTTRVGNFTYQNDFNFVTDPTGAAGTKNKFCYYLAQNLRVDGTETCPTSTDGSVPGIEFATTTDGSTWYISPGNATAASQFILGNVGENYKTKIIIDVNGKNKAPNCSADTMSSTFMPASYVAASGDKTKCPKPDTFIIGIRQDGRTRVGMSSPTGTDEGKTDQTALDILNDPLDNKK